MKIDVYAAIAARPHASTADIAGDVGQPEDEIRVAIGELVDVGLVVPSQVTDNGWRAVHPSLSIGLDIAKQETELTDRLERLADARNSLVELTQAYSSVARETEIDAVISLHHRDAVLMQIDRLVGGVQFEIAAFVSSKPSTQAITASRPLDTQLINRGVAMRSVCLAAFLRDAQTNRALRESAEMGLHVRVSPTLPSRVLIFDRREAIVANDSADPGRGAVYVRNPAMVGLLVDLFERYWSNATPIDKVDDTTEDLGITPTEQAVLRLLALGHKDEAVARSTGQSVRTVRRIVAGTCEKVGARGRFDLALKAVSRGWITDEG